MVLNTITLTLVSKLQQFDGLLLVFLYNKTNHNDITEIIVKVMLHNSKPYYGVLVKETTKRFKLILQAYMQVTPHPTPLSSEPFNTFKLILVSCFSYSSN